MSQAAKRGLGATLFGLVVAIVAALALLAASPNPPPEPAADALAPVDSAGVQGLDQEREQCRARIGQVLRDPEAPGSPLNHSVRLAVLGRARGEPLLWVREPAQAVPGAVPESARKATAALSRLPHRTRLARLIQRLSGDKPALRALVLREGYVYASDPAEALALTQELRVEALFDEPQVVIQRGRQRLLAETSGEKRRRHYVYTSGPQAGQRAELLFGDRVSHAGADGAAGGAAKQATVLHVDLARLSAQYGVSRVRLVHLAEQGLVAELRFDTVWIRALLLVDDHGGADIACLDADQATRRLASAWQQNDAPRRTALARLRQAVDAMLADGLRFDRPQGEETADRDGELRPAWLGAYRNQQSYFRVDDTSYAVFDPQGNAAPPQVCVDFVLESFERAAGTWFAPRGQRPERQVGRFDLNAYGIKNRRGVLALESFASSTPALFDTLKLEDSERVPFAQRERFFGLLAKRADEFRPGDILAIRGLKADGRVHQHAILLEHTDPLTGFPYGLADHMSKPRRRSWEGIMAEAPRRSLYFRIRLRAAVFEQLALGSLGEGS